MLRIIARHSLPAVAAALLLCCSLPLRAAAPQGWVGIVLSIDAEDGTPKSRINSVVIETVVPSSPAAKAGLAAGDVILEIEGHDVANITADVLKTSLKKSVGETVHLKIKHDDQAPQDVAVMAAALPT